MFLIQGADQLARVAVHDVVELVERQIDAVIGDAALRKIIGADALGAVARADLELARLRLRTRLFLALVREQPRLQERQRARAILVLRALVLAFDHDAGGQMGDANRRVGLVDVLAAGAGGAIGIDAQIRRIQVDGFDLLELGQESRPCTAEVWMRPCASVAGTRCTRCVPDSNLSSE